MIRNDPPLTGTPFTTLELIPTTIFSTPVEASQYVAHIIAETIRQHNDSKKATVLGLATGHTPIGVYRELIRLHHEEGLDLSRVVTFNLDEYYPMPPDSIQSYRRWMRENFFDHVNVPDDQIHIPRGDIPEEKLEAHCQAYEEAIVNAGGIDIQILGIGRTGHIGFNEPGSSRQSRTRPIILDPVTRRDAAADFFGETSVPRRAITMGVGTILDARRVLLMALGEQKAPIVKCAVEGEITSTVAASFLQQHAKAEFIVDAGASAQMTRVATPWLLGEVEWRPDQEHRAVIWLSEQRQKSILKLDQDEYDTHHLASLLRKVGSADKLNRRAYHRLAQTIVHPGQLPKNKRMLCFSPHPDDDVISMGGTLTHLVKRDNEVHVAYMTSGNIAVFDDHALQMLHFWHDLNTIFDCAAERSGEILQETRQFLTAKMPGVVDTPEVQHVKDRMRRSEALAACRAMGIPPAHAHFLDLPFYQTGEVRKRPISDKDVQIVLELLEQLKPDWIFVAGELSDPHGTHRLCAEAIFAALKKVSPDARPEVSWLYRGAWQEWEPDAIDMAVPLTRSELNHKTFGIFKHQSQKDKALFPGPYDDREFWQRAVARNTDTANLYNQFGLPEHYAMEAFVRYEDY